MAILKVEAGRKSRWQPAKRDVEDARTMVAVGHGTGTFLAWRLHIGHGGDEGLAFDAFAAGRGAGHDPLRLFRARHVRRPLRRWNDLGLARGSAGGFRGDGRTADRRRLVDGRLAGAASDGGASGLGRTGQEPGRRTGPDRPGHRHDARIDVGGDGRPSARGIDGDGTMAEAKRLFGRTVCRSPDR